MPGGLPVTLSVPPSLSPAASQLVEVRVAGADVAARAQVKGVVVSLSRSDGSTSAATVDVAIDYSAFGAGFGADFGARLRLVSLPACALTTPELPMCQVQTPVEGVVNRVSASTLSARVTVMPALVGGAGRRLCGGGACAGGGSGFGCDRYGGDWWFVVGVGVVGGDVVESVGLVVCRFAGRRVLLSGSDHGAVCAGWPFARYRVLVFLEVV
jgi:hypothetical protein